ncbi:hypothetical protein [Mesorhizobium xinjiangense]|uniref:hypothetical protein n=1 Tax=Mesorhizobium xinjiangense TaxID=2678685 RepID=UPI0012EE0776|nr:hypothetical protein [Mesorhizobium xinjiangense]
MIHSETTLDELLNEPIIRKVMARDGVRTNDIRALMNEISGRARHATHNEAILLPPPGQMRMMERRA